MSDRPLLRKMGISLDVVARVLVGTLAFGIAAGAFSRGQLYMAAAASLVLALMIAPTSMVHWLTWRIRWPVALALFVLAALVTSKP